MAGSLFERLTKGEAGFSLSEDESIRHHLLRMFTTRQGAVQAIPDYGLPDLNDLTMSRSELMDRSATAISTCIRSYEPRLLNVEVKAFTMEKGHFTMGFVVKAMKRDEKGQLVPWKMNLSVDGPKVTER